MTPGKSSKIGTTSKERVKQQPRNTGVVHSDNKLESLASQLQHETEEKKEVIMNGALRCIFTQLPEAMTRLDTLLSELVKLAETHYSVEANKTWLISESSKTPPSVPVKYKFALDNACLTFPFGSQQQKDCKQWISTGGAAPGCNNKSSVFSGKRLLSGICANHLLVNGESHRCVHSYSFANTVNLLPGGPVPAATELNPFLDELRSIFVTLSQHFVNITLGLSLMFPRKEDNESSNLSLKVLNKLLNLASLDYISFFENNSHNRASLILKVATYPHFGESRRMLFDYDCNAVLELQLIVQNLISMCARIYDLLVKNFDSVLKAKETCNQQARSKKPKRTATGSEAEDKTSTSPPSNHFYS